jgi:L-alanine-DL-glutamate epimerase-like enolase superfamily enzyme
MERQNKHDRMYARIEKHGHDLKRIFSIDGDPIEICKKLRRLEVEANRMAVAYCNGEIDAAEWEIFSKRIGGKVLNIIGRKYADWIQVNGDARGYTLKIKNEIVREKQLDIYRDWGGYGILAPDFKKRG